MTILRRGSVPPDAARRDFESRRLSDAGGLTQYGAYLQTLQAGQRTSDRHWHAQEDEFLYLLSGEATVVDDAGAHALQPGDAVCWPAGEPNAHHVINRSQAPCSFLIVGTRVERDTTHYPDRGCYYTVDGRNWKKHDAADGRVLQEGVE
jgi:uncharacterized cupin superfamily protein